MAIIKRYSGNPILTKDDIPYEVATVHNAGAIKFKDKYILLFRSHLLNGRSIIGIAESIDGYNFKVRPEPFMTPSTAGDFKQYEEFGVEDPRITFIDGVYLITYSAYSKYGVRIGLAKTNDFNNREYGVLIKKRIISNVSGTILATQKGTIGLAIGLDF